MLVVTSRMKRAWCKQDVCPKSVIMNRSGAWKYSVQAGHSPLTLSACRSTQDGCCCMHREHCMVVLVYYEVPAGVKLLVLVCTSSFCPAGGAGG